MLPPYKKPNPEAAPYNIDCPFFADEPELPPDPFPEAPPVTLPELPFVSLADDVDDVAVPALAIVSPDFRI